MVAQWRVLLNTEEDRERYDVLERAMPGVVVSAFGESLEGGTALAHFLQSGVDGLLRVFVRRVPSFNIEQYFSDNSKGSAVRAAAIAWLRALVAPIGLFASTSPEMLKLETRLKKWSGAVQISRQSFELALSLRVITPTITPPAFAEGESEGEGDSQSKR